MRLTTPKKVSAESGLHILLYGEPGAGKTVLAAQAPKALVVTPQEREAESLNNHPDLAETPILVLDRWEQWSAISRVLQHKELPEYDTIVIDTLSTVYDVCMGFLMGRIQDRDTPSQNEYTQANRYIMQVVRQVFATGKSVVLVCHMRVDKNEDGAVIKHLPDLSPTLLNDVLAEVSACYWLGFQGRTRTLRINGHSRYILKNRYGKLPDQLDNPTFSKLLKELNNNE